LEVCFHELFQRQAARTPDAIAAVDANQIITYRELNDRANRLARRLRKAGVGPDVVVGALMHRSIDLLTSMLAVFKAGGAYLPLDPHHPTHRQRQVLTQGRVSHVISTRGLEQTLEPDTPGSPRLDLFFIEDLAENNEPGNDLSTLNTPDHLAYVIFTSGSTGLPKGAMIEHRGMLNHLYAKLHDLGVGPKDVIAQTAPQWFDISLWQFLSALLVGGRVLIVSEEVAVHPRQIFEQATLEDITILEVVPSLLRATLENMEIDRVAALNLPALRWLLLTGEALPPELARRWLERHPGIPALNAYGPTECSDDVTHYPIRDPEALNSVNTPIGRPILNTHLYALNRDLQPTPIGVPGELYVGGVCVGRGYLNDAIKTAQAFIPNPFVNGSGSTSRLYRTGDLAQFLPSGDIEFLGRLDHQVKVRGFRIELGEIESVLDEHPAVRQAVVLAREDSPGDTRLVAYVVPTGPAAVDIEMLRVFLRERLPEYMRPAAYVVLEQLPLTPAGKLDRKGLMVPQYGRGASDSFVAPRDAFEEVIAEIWREVLRVERIGVHDNFFELGGHSLLATQVVARLSRLMQIELPLRRMFEAPTIAELVVDLVRLDRGSAETTLERILREVEALADEETA
jgi:amino acid adenylation domain-containing protein